MIDRDVVIRGCPEATLVARGQGPIFRVTRKGRLRISQLALYSGPQPTALALVELEAGARLVAREVGFLAVPLANGGGVAIYDSTTTIVEGGERIRRGHTNGPIRVALPAGYLDHLDDLTVPDDADVMALSGG